MGDNSFKKDEKAIRAKVRFLIEKNLRKGLDSESIVELIRQELPNEVYHPVKQNVAVQHINAGQQGGSRVTEQGLTAFWSFFKSINLKLRKLPCYNRFIFPIVNKIKANLPLVLKHRNAVSYRYFTDLGIHDFIVKAYEYILERTPSYEELCLQRDNLISCNGNRVLVVGSIRYSAEGRIRRKPIKGLYFRYKKSRFFHLISKIPLLGYFIKLIKHILTVSSSLEMLRRADIEKSWAVEDIYFNLEILRNDHYRLKALIKDIRENLNASNDKINSEMNDIKGDIKLYKENIAAHGEALSSHKDEILRLYSSLSEYREALSSHKDEIVRLYSSLSEYGEALSSHKDEIVQLYGSLSEKVDNITGDLSGKVEGVSTSHEVIVKELDAVKDYIDVCNRDKEIALAAVEENNNLFSDVYLQFENKFRGDRQMIKERLRFYLPIMENLDVQNGHNYSNIVDIGCGRGEWLELLKENRFIHMGVDTNTDMVSECHKFGLKAVQGDGIEYLKGLESDSVYVVTAFHVVEHLEKKELVRLLKETQRVVKSGGMAIFETPNPENLIIGSCNFYTDMTHLRPIPPSLLMFLCEAVGFDRVDIVRLNPYNAIDVEKLDKTNESLMTMANFFNNASDYAILAYKE